MKISGITYLPKVRIEKIKPGELFSFNQNDGSFIYMVLSKVTCYVKVIPLFRIINSTLLENRINCSVSADRWDSEMGHPVRLNFLPEEQSDYDNFSIQSIISHLINRIDKLNLTTKAEYIKQLNLFIKSRTKVIRKEDALVITIDDLLEHNPDFSRVLVGKEVI